MLKRGEKVSRAPHNLPNHTIYPGPTDEFHIIKNQVLGGQRIISIDFWIR